MELPAIEIFTRSRKATALRHEEPEDEEPAHMAGAGTCHRAPPAEFVIASPFMTES